MKNNKLQPVEIHDLFTYQFPGNLQYSPDGKFLVFEVAKAREKENDYTRNVWISNNGEVKQLSYNIDASIVSWLDDKNLLIQRNTKKETGVTELFVLPVDGGEAMPLMTLPFVLSSLKVVDKNTFVATGTIDADDADAYKDDEKTRKEKLEKKEADKDYTVIDEVPYWHNGQNYTNKKRTALFLIEKDKVKRISKKYENVQSFIIEDRDIYFLSETHVSKESRFNDLYSYSIDKKTRKEIYTKKDMMIRNVFFLNHELYGMAADLKSYGLNQTPDFVKITKNKMEFVKDPHRRLGASGGTDTMLGSGKSQEIVNNTIYATVSDEDRVEIWSFDDQFNEKVLFDLPGVCFFLDACNNQIAFVYSDAKGPSEIYEMDLSGENVKKLTNLNGDSVKGKYVALPETIDYVSAGIKQRGWVLLPKDYDAKKKYPAILDIHGGPRAMYTEAFFHEMQVWASHGYFVFFTNICGSDGRDDDYADIRGKYGTIDYQNLMDFTDIVTQKYSAIDMNKLCVTGGSYGGFMTNWIIGHTDRFCSAASQRSIASWISLTFMADIGLWFDPGECGLAVDENLFDGFDRMWNSSPLKYVENAKTPTLFIHSDEDRRCPLPEGMQMMQALAYKGVDTRMCIFHGENHELSRSGKPLHRVKRLEEITNWFDKYTEKENGKE